MYYEEQWVEGALCWRTSPYGAWTRYTANELAHRYESAEKRAADAQAQIEALQTVIRQMGEQAAVLAKDGMAAKGQVEALQRVRDHAKKMEAVQKEVADNQTWHVCELRQQLTQLQALVSGMKSIIPHQHCRTCNQYADELRNYDIWGKRTLDATTPAAKGGDGE